MNEFVVTSNNCKRIIKIIEPGKVEIDGKIIDARFSRVNNYSFLLKVGNSAYEITTTKLNNQQYSFLIDGHYFETTVRTTLEEKANELLKQQGKLSHHDSINAPMPGMILKIKCKEGDSVNLGDSLIVLEAMKMENDIKASASGTVKEILIKENTSVEKGTPLIIIE